MDGTGGRWCCDQRLGHYPLRRAGVTIRDLSTDEPNLEDIFLHLTGSGAAVPGDDAETIHRGGDREQGIPGRRGPPGEDPSRAGGL